MNEEYPDKRDQYVQGLELDREVFAAREEYFFQHKSSQQLLLEKLLLGTGRQFSEIGDIACGNGALSFHLADLYPQARFTLVDLSQEMIHLAQRSHKEREHVRFIVNDIYAMTDVHDNTFDLICCWQTLSWLEKPQAALDELLRCTKPDGRIYLSSLFNLEHDVDIYAKVYDHTRLSSRKGHYLCYNTYSASSVEGWLEGKVKKWSFHPHQIEVDLAYQGRGLGTSTLLLMDGRRIQVSAGMMLNWAILEITKLG